MFRSKSAKYNKQLPPCKTSYVSGEVQGGGGPMECSGAHQAIPGRSNPVTWPQLKGLSHEIEGGCRWYGSLDLYVERCRRRFVIFLSSLSIYYSTKSPLSGVAKY
jgi:hypothetical protein